MADHVVKRTLRRDVLPYLISARQLRRQWFYRVHVVFGYATDLVVALAAIGIGSPLLRLIGTNGEASKGAPDAATFAGAIASVPPVLLYPTTVLILAWVIIRIAFNREDGQRRAVLARSCTRVLRQAEASLPTALGNKYPMQALNEMLEKKIRPTVDRNIQDDSWPWVPFAPRIDADVEREVTALCARFENDWEPIDPDLRQPPKPEDKP